ncbi:MAG: hypothetical protein AAF547_20060 [Actinomycetota bacterium]
MRLLRLDFRDDLNSIDFHPLLTVVSSLTDGQRRQLFEAVRRLSGGTTVGLRGLVEHQGLLVELDATSGEPLGKATTTAAVLVFVDGVAIRQDQVGLQAEIDRWERQATIDAVAVEEIRSNLDLSIRAEAFNLCRQADPNGLGAVEQAASPRRLKVDAVRRAYDAVNAHERTIADCDPVIIELLNRWNDHLALVKDSEDHLDQVAAEVRQAERGVTTAENRLAEAKQAAKPVLLSQEDEARLETLTDIWNESNSDKKRKRSLTEEEEQERLGLLASVNVKSWTEYTVFRLSPTVAPERLAAVDEAELELRVAAQTLERARDFQARDEVAIRIEESLASIKTDATPFLGVLVPADIGAALQAQIVEVENPDWVQAVNDLRDALSSNDLHPPYGFEPAEILGWTDSWLRAQDSLETTGRGDDDDGTDHEALLVRLGEARQTLVKHNRALAQIDRAERVAVRSAMRVRDLKTQLRQRSTGPEPTSASEVVSMIRPVAERVAEDIEGSVPIAVVGDLGSLSDLEAEVLMSQLEAIAKRVQVILVSGHPALPGWVKRVGLERAGQADGARALV